ncbi:MAG TPA: ATP-binding protein [Thermoanaerobaculia bacterium]|jgi:two-component system sensor histidine kinase/response regulator|nr:ATP-binding protein [Thermoanaerobaculia bacterium]
MQPDAVSARALELFTAARDRNFRRVDRIFLGLMAMQWVFGIVLALMVSPYSYAGAERVIHPHVWLAVFLGAAISALPIALAILRPGAASTRHVIAAAQMLWSGLLIHLSGGRIETHFHIFGSLAMVAFYRDWKTLVTATAVVVSDHFARGVLVPESVYGAADPEWWRFLEHAGWVLFEDAFLASKCVYGTNEMREVATRQAEVEAGSERERLKSVALDAALVRETHLNEELRTQLTEIERAEAEVAWLTIERELILDSAANGIVGLDLQMRPTLMNRAATEMTGWTVEELAQIAEPHGTVHRTGPDGAPCRTTDCTVFRAATTGEPSLSQEWLAHREGRIFPVEMRVTPMVGRTGVRVGTVCTYHDIADRLEIRRIRELDRLKNEFISTVSHELRTPLTSIRGALRLLDTGRLGALPERGKRMFDIAVSNTERLAKLINDILDVERIESGSAMLSMEPCDAARLIEQATDVVRPLLHAHRIRVAASANGEMVVADADRIVQMLTNLLSNAIKFSPEGSTIRVGATRRKDGAVVVSVADEGRGIPAACQEAIFERFQQVDAADARAKGGSGLGLAICRAIVRQHGGEIWVESEPGRGSCFSFSIPAAVAPGQRQQLVLLTEDPELAATLQTAFAAHAIDVVRAATEQQAREVAQRVDADVVVLDLRLPDFHAAAVAEWLSDEGFWKGKPLLACAPQSQESPDDRPRLSVAAEVFTTTEELVHRTIALLRAPARAVA